MDGDRCWWLAADFDGPAAMLDALAYLKAARAAGAPAVLEVSRSGKAHTRGSSSLRPSPAATARQVGTGLLREAIALRGRMDLSSYDRLFPSQDVLHDQRSGQPDRRAAAGQVPTTRRHRLPGPGHSGTAPRTSGTTCPVSRACPLAISPDWRKGSARSASARPWTGCVPAPQPGSLSRSRDRTGAAGSRNHCRGCRLCPRPLLATLKHAASMPNPLFYERQRRRASTWDTPRFLRSYDANTHRRPDPAPRAPRPADHPGHPGGQPTRDDRRPRPARCSAGIRLPGARSTQSSRPPTTPWPATTSECWSPHPAPVRP